LGAVERRGACEQGGSCHAGYFRKLVRFREEKIDIPTSKIIKKKTENDLKRNNKLSAAINDAHLQRLSTFPELKEQLP